MRTDYTCDNGLLLIISGPSGVGKNTVINALKKRVGNILLSISATTRAPREGETDGVNYYFKTREQFETMIKNDELIEYAQYNGNYYGSPKGALFEWTDKGNIAILEIEVQGAKKAKAKCHNAVTVFMAPPSMATVLQRLRGRNTEQEAVIQARYVTAFKELACAYDYDYVVINDDIEKAVDRLEAIIFAETLKLERNRSIIDRLSQEK